MTLDDRIASAVRAAHYAVKEVPVTQQLDSDILAAGSDAHRRPVRRRWVALVAAASLVLAAFVGIAAWQKRAHAVAQPAAPTGKLIHPAMLAGQGQFRLDPAAAIARNTDHVFFAHWSDLPDGGMIFMRPVWVVDPRTGAYLGTEGGSPAADGLAAWAQANPRLDLGPPASVVVGGEPAIQFAMHGTHGTGSYTWLCPDQAHEDCFDAPPDGLGYVTFVTHNGAQYVLVGGAKSPSAQVVAIQRYRQTLQSWTWGE